LSTAKIIKEEDIGKSSRRVVYLDNEDDYKNNFKYLLKGITNSVTTDVLINENIKIKNK